MFPFFPEFKPLLLEDKDSYGQLVEAYPPYSDLIFSTLHIWWNLNNQLTVSTLDENVIINYELPFDEQNSGYGLIGTHDIDNAIETIFSHLHANGMEPKLVHVPEFTIKSIDNSERYKLEEEIDYNEYLFESDALATLDGPDLGRIRRKVARFSRETEDGELRVTSLDLDSDENKELIMQSIVSWEEARPARNDPDHTEHDAIRQTLKYANVLDIKNLCLYLNNELHAVVLYDITPDNNYCVLHHLKVNYKTPFIFDYVTQLIAQEAVKTGVKYINMEMDLGIENLRYHKMGLRPVDFFRKYTVRPAADL